MLKGGAFIMKKIPVTILAYAGVLVAMNILLSRVFTINLGNSIRINFSAAPIFLAGIWFGPFIGGLTGIAADLMGCVVSGYAPFPLITVSTCLWGVIPGIMSGFLRTKKTETVWEGITSYLRVIFVLGITMAITSQGITTYALSQAYGTPLGVLFLSRLPVTVVTLLSNAFVVDLFVRRVRIRFVGASRSNGQSF